MSALLLHLRERRSTTRTGVWSQRASVFVIPPILLIARDFRRGCGEVVRVWRSAGSRGCSQVLLFTQDFYTAAFAVLIIALMLSGARIVGAAPAPLEGRQSWGRIARGSRASLVAGDRGPRERLRGPAR